MRKSASALTPEEAEAIALLALAFVASDAPRLARFLALTGISPETLKTRAGDRDVLVAVLDHVLHDESMLLEFTANSAIAPHAIAPAHHILSSG